MWVGAPHPPQEQADVGQAVAAALAVGRTVTLAQAIAEALRETD